MSLRKAAPSVPKLVFNNGQQNPIIGLGTWKSAPGEVIQAVKDAIDAGYRHIDCAHLYENENEVGEAVNAKIAEGIIKRQDIFLTSKLWNTDHNVANVRPAILTTLKNLNTEYLDLYLIHLPVALAKVGDDLFPTDSEGNVLLADEDDFVDTWSELERAVDDGLIRSIGVSNFNRAQIERILAMCRIRPVTNQIECHPYLTQIKLSEWLRSENILVTGYSPLGSPDRPWAKAGDAILLEEPLLQEIAERYKKSTAQILIRYQIERGHIVIPKSVTKSRIISNFNVFDFRLSEEDVKAINGFERNGRFLPMDVYKASKFFPFNDEF